jgi:DNA-binding NtrC family response regulator
MAYKVFIVEDNKTEGLMIQLAFSGIENISISYFSYGAELLENLHEQPDITIVDMVLPDIHGLEIIKKIKEMHPTGRIIVMSADERAGLIAQAQSEGVYNYIVKGESSLRYLKLVVEDLLILLKAQQNKE